MINYKKTLAECAWTNDKGENEQLLLKHGEKEVTNLDGMCIAFKKMYGNGTLSSCDAFYESSDYYFIEFKNQPYQNIVETIPISVFNDLYSDKIFA